MNKLLILTNILIPLCVGLCASEVIPLGIQSTRQFNFETVNLDSNGEHQYNPHVFEIEPSTSPLRLVFNSESSPLSLELEKEVAKVFEETPLQNAPDAKQDRSGAVDSTADSADDSADGSADETAGSNVNVGSDGYNVGGGAYNEDEYTIVDQYQRYVPVKVRENGEESMGSDDSVFIVKPAKSPKTESKMKVKKVRIPVIKMEKLVTSKPVLAKQVSTEASVEKTTPAETMTESSNTAETPKFGARIARHTNKKEMDKKDKKSKNKKQN